MSSTKEVRVGEYFLVEGINNYLHLNLFGIHTLEEALAKAKLKTAQAKKKRLECRDRRRGKYVVVVCKVEMVELEEPLEPHEKKPRKPRPPKTDRLSGVRRAAPGKRVLGRGVKDE